MANLLDLQSQIAKLQQQASELRTKEFASTVQDIVSKMQAFGITVKDLQAALAKPGKGKRGRKAVGAEAKSAKGAKKNTVKRVGVAVAPKYMGPNGETWTGRGLAPKWLTTQIGEG